MRLLLLALLAAAPSAQAAYDANGVALGGSERDVKKAFPVAYCKPLEWTTPAADRRCDDAKATFGGVAARITFYLRKDVVQAFDVRFETRDLEKVVGALKSRYGKPSTETRDTFSSRAGKEIYKVVWESGKDRAALVSQVDKSRAQLTVTRGSFEEDIYRVR